MLRKPAALLFCLALVVASLAFLVNLPPWNSRTLQQIHRAIRDVTGHELHVLNDYSGPLRIWDAEGHLTLQATLLNGDYDGLYTEYTPTGAIVRRCTYRQGQPWDGLCQIIPRKAWLAEYKSGEPWNGTVPVKNAQTGKVEWTTFINGKAQE